MSESLNMQPGVLLLAGEIGGIPGALQVEQIVNKAWHIDDKKKPEFKRLR